ncbi:Aldo/keto reductase [Alkalibacterium putridalgicola]|uniref:2,5-diketo-D-gluconic acid reductase n=1 Tax=Alkalibacterium putridalgicola TaxID=426703 RepID=A0A1H7QJI5_9LACT|nr:aldo/keto reductase [Alkalibacterium putridalgicola]GEK88449.1 2,5-diketo-D-gluconic acid reductase [Alkalibacterium putridalgicola]SEL47918.1 Aldo/keto reductase [Alkalibacterium putridalgicola]
MSLTDGYQMNNGLTIPKVGFGTWQAKDNEAKQSVLWALEAGYRHIDTAQGYNNEEEVGEAIKESGVKREEIFLTTKLHNKKHGYDNTVEALNDSLNKLDTDYIDLVLIHWPNPKYFRDNWKEANAESWKAMEEFVAKGKVKTLGVSNFQPHHLDALLETANIKPAVNQILLNPSEMQPEVVKYNTEHNIINEAYSPLGTGKIFDIDVLKDLAEKYDKSIAQLVLRWSLQHDFLPLPKTVTKERVWENADIFDFEISDADMKIIDGMTGRAGSATDPDTITF